jgi:hypothetical protein
MGLSGIQMTVACNRKRNGRNTMPGGFKSTCHGAGIGNIKAYITKHKKILVAKVREYDYQEVAKQIESLIQFAKDGKVFPTVKLMKQIVPEFKSKNSVYEELDA